MAQSTEFYLDYVAAVADDDNDAQDAALEGLRDYRSDFSTFLAEANPFLDADGLEALLETHTDHLVAQVAAYKDEDYRQAYSTLREGYAPTELLAGGLGGAIADQFPQQFSDTAMPLRTDAIATRQLGLNALCALQTDRYANAAGQSSGAAL